MKEPPVFKYFSDPYVHHAFIQEDTRCDCICPACVADGSAAKKFDLVFNEIDEDVSPTVRDTIEHKTSGIISWQEHNWEVNCVSKQALPDRASVSGSLVTHLLF